MYWELIKKLALLNRCHNGPEMRKAYKLLVEYYEGSRIIKHNKDYSVNYWRIPPFWTCDNAYIQNSKGNYIVKNAHKSLSLFTYSPSFKGSLNYNELKEHILTDEKRPKDQIFHFRNQYRINELEWGFSIPFEKFKQLDPNDVYDVLIESKFDYTKKLYQSDFHLEGKNPQTYLILGHFDHPYQVNDGLTGTVAAYEVIKRLRERKKKTRYSYRAFASVEIVGSVFYLDEEVKDKFVEAMFLGFAGINSEIAYQDSFEGSSMFDRLFKLYSKFHHKNQKYSHREVVGNDEMVFDSIGYEIPTSTLFRWPFKNYHTSSDTVENTSVEKLEELINLTLSFIDQLEKNFIVKPLFNGLLSLASPEIDLYLDPVKISGIKRKKGIKANINNIINLLSYKEQCYIQKNPSKLSFFMRKIMRIMNGKLTILDIAERTEMPFDFVFEYVSKLEKKNMVELV